jgi:1,4-alpha-glucan branching enzyme
MATTKKPSKAATTSTATTSAAATAKPREVTFEIEAPKASKVLIAGTFNNWRETALTRDKSGKWTTKVALPPGTHQYRYMVDGNWVTAPGTPTVQNPFGSVNNVVVVN